MGFRTDAYATVWGEPKDIEVKGKTANRSISISKKEGDGYRQTFSGFVTFIGEENVKRIRSVPNKGRIKLKNVDVETAYNKNTKENKVFFKVFGFEILDKNGNPVSMAKKAAPKNDDPQFDDSQVFEISDNEYPF